MSSGVASPLNVRRGVIQTMAGNASTMVINVVVGALTARLLGVEGRGQLAAFRLVPELLFLISIMGVHEAVTYHAARRWFGPDVVLGSALWITTPLAIVGTAASVTIIPYVLAQYPPGFRIAAQMYSIMIPIELFYGVPMRLLQGGGHFGRWTQLRLLGNLNTLLALLLLWTANRVTAVNYAFAITPARLITGFITERGIARAADWLVAMFPDEQRKQA